jgi:hypothetical protein
MLETYQHPDFPALAFRYDGKQLTCYYRGRILEQVTCNRDGATGYITSVIDRCLYRRDIAHLRPLEWLDNIERALATGQRVPEFA